MRYTWLFVLLAASACKKDEEEAPELTPCEQAARAPRDQLAELLVRAFRRAFAGKLLLDPGLAAAWACQATARERILARVVGPALTVIAAA